MACRSKGERNHRFGKKASAQTREKIRQKALARIQKPRKKTSSTEDAGRGFARRWFDMPEVCERCGEKPPCDRHHVDGNPQNNAPANIQFLCRRCHQETDGRIEMLRSMNRTKAEATHCKRGHPLNEKRQCRVCMREAEGRYRARRKKK
jgi:hypothetical protein